MLTLTTCTDSPTAAYTVADELSYRAWPRASTARACSMHEAAARLVCHRLKQPMASCDTRCRRSRSCRCASCFRSTPSSATWPTSSPSSVRRLAPPPWSCSSGCAAFRPPTMVLQLRSCCLSAPHHGPAAPDVLPFGPPTMVLQLLMCCLSARARLFERQCRHPAQALLCSDMASTVSMASMVYQLARMDCPVCWHILGGARRAGTC